MKIWLRPVPEAGEIDVTPGDGGGGGFPTVHEPFGCHPVFVDASDVYMKVVFAPANAVLKVNPKVAVMFVPEWDTADVDPLKMHWLFWALSDVLRLTGPCQYEDASSVR